MCGKETILNIDYGQGDTVWITVLMDIRKLKI